MNIDDPEMAPIVPIVSKSEIDGSIETPKDALEATVPEPNSKDEMQARIDHFKENVPPHMKVVMYDRILDSALGDSYILHKRSLIN